MQASRSLYRLECGLSAGRRAANGVRGHVVPIRANDRAARLLAGRGSGPRRAIVLSRERHRASKLPAVAQAPCVCERVRGSAESARVARPRLRAATASDLGRMQPRGRGCVESGT